MPGTQVRAAGEIRALTGLRLVAALWVVAHHYWLFAPDHPWLRFLEPARPLLESGWLGVDLFFVLSGFVLTHTYVAALGHRPRLRASASFYWARLSRIWPTWLVVLTAVTAGVLVKQLVGGATESRIDAPTMLRQILLVQVWDRADHSATGPVGPGWSLSAEWLAYLLFPALALLLYRLRSCRTAVLALLSLVAVTPFAAMCLALGVHDWSWSWLLRLSGCFLSGALVALAVRRLRARAGSTRAVERAATAAVVTAGGLFLVALWWGRSSGADVAGATVLLFPVLVGALALGRGGPARWLASPPVVLGGRISFALYLIHMAVFEVFWTLGDAVPALGGVSPAASLLVVVLPVLPLPVAWLLWRAVEEPARRRMRALDPARPRPVPEPVARPAGRVRPEAPVSVNG